MEKENKYLQSKIYKIVCNITSEVYYGSTYEPTVARRLATHISDYKKWKNGKSHFVSSFPIFERGDYSIYLVELYPCQSKDELRAREGFYQLNNECVNKCIAGRSDKQYIFDNADKIREQKKQYYIDNADKILEQKKQYYIDNRDIINERQKQYNIDNRDKIKEQKKQYNIDNRDIINERRKQYKLKKMNIYTANIVNITI